MRERRYQVFYAQIRLQTSKNTIKNIYDENGTKLEGIDGFLVDFFTLNWSIVKKDLILIVKEFFESSKVLNSFRCTIVTLVPKDTNTTYVKDHRPIAYCTMVYKMMTKVPTSYKRIKLIVKNIVIPSQSDFVEGGSIVDNILFSYEIFKWYSRKGIYLHAL